MRIKPFHMLLLLLATAGCAPLHDGAGWEHTGDPATHQDASPYILEHRH